MAVYGITDWYLRVKSYDWKEDIEAGDKDATLDNVFEKILNYAKSNAKTQKEVDSLERLRGNRNFYNVTRTQIGEVNSLQLDFDDVTYEKYSRDIREATTSEEVETITESIPEIPTKLRQQIGRRRATLENVEIRKEDLFSNPELRTEGYRTWNSIQRFYELNDEELSRLREILGEDYLS